MSATLGGYIKDLRLQKNIPQLEIAFALGWKEPARLSRIEQGKVANPPRELVDQIMNAMHLNEEERNHLLLVGNYLPTKEDIEEARKKIDPIIESWPFPASSQDYSWRIISTNQKLYKVLSIPPEMQKVIEEKTPRVIEVVFEDNFPLNKATTPEAKEKRREFLSKTLVHFQYEQRTRNRERWYLDLIQKMMNNPLFRELWILTSKKEDLSDPIEFTVKEMPTKEGNLLSFYVFMVPLFHDPRFFLEVYTPADKETFSYF